VNVSTDDEILTEKEVEQKFPAKKQGVQLRKYVQEHQLIGQGYYREWLDVNGARQVIYGKIVNCWLGFDKKVDGEEHYFTVEYDSFCVQLHKHTGIPVADHNVPGAAAWGGYVAFCQVMQTKRPPLQVPFHFKWILPAKPKGKMVQMHEGFALQFFVKKSGEHCAGRGLWVKCTRLATTPKQAEFILPEGHLFCIGHYGPFSAKDCKSEVVYLVKNFIHLGDASTWSFERASHEDGYIDVTDDWFGLLCKEAEDRLVVYTNETSSKKKKASVHGRHDPTGAVQYYMGHCYEGQGPFKLPVDKPTELFVSTPIRLERDRAPSIEFTIYPFVHDTTITVRQQDGVWCGLPGSTKQVCTEFKESKKQKNSLSCPSC
jgi:hypothetical protein